MKTKFFVYLIVLILISAVSGMFWILSYTNPLAEEKKRIDSRRAELLKSQKKSQRLKKDIATVSEKIKKRKAEIVTLLREKTKDRDIEKFINNIEKEAKNAEISLKNIRILPKSQRQRYIEIPMEFVMEGTYIELYDFFFRLESLQMLNLTKSSVVFTGGGSSGRGQKIKNLEKKIDKNKTLTDLEGKDVKLKKIGSSTEFPKLRVTLNGGRIIIIDKATIQRYEDA